MQAKSRNSVDVILISALVLFIDLLLLVPDLASNTVRIILAIPLVFFIPGYLLLSIFLKEDRDSTSLLFLSLILSIFITIVVAVIINSLSSQYSEIALNPISLVIALSFITLIMCIITLFVRKQYFIIKEKKSRSDILKPSTSEINNDSDESSINNVDYK